MIEVWGILIATSLEDILEDLRSETGLLKDIEDMGGDYLVTCPEHKGGQESNPSCSISKGEHIKLGTVHCFTCNFSTDLLGLISNVLELDDKRKAMEWLLKRYNQVSTTNKESRPSLNFEFTRGKQEDIEIIIADDKVDYHTKLYQATDRAKKYMENRGLINTPELFKVGYNPNTDSIMIPVNTVEGKTLYYKERSIEGKRFYNQKGVQKGTSLFAIDKALARLNEDKDIKVWLVESEIDAMTVYEYGDVAIAIGGSSLTSTQRDIIAKSPIKNIIDGLDRDRAGREGIRKIIHELRPYGIRFWMPKWIEGKKDINEYSREEYEILISELK